MLVNRTIESSHLVVGCSATLVADVELDGSPMSLTGTAAYFCMKRHRNDPDSAILIQLLSTLAGGSDAEIAFITPDGGNLPSRLQLSFTVAQTGTLDNVARSYAYDIILSRPGGIISCLDSGSISFYPAISRTIALLA